MTTLMEKNLNQGIEGRSLDAEVMERIAKLTNTNHDETIKFLRNKNVPTADQILSGMAVDFNTEEELSFNEQDVLGSEIVQEIANTDCLVATKVDRFVLFAMENFQPEMIVYFINEIKDYIPDDYFRVAKSWKELVKKYDMFFTEDGEVKI